MVLLLKSSWWALFRDKFDHWNLAIIWIGKLRDIIEIGQNWQKVKMGECSVVNAYYLKVWRTWNLSFYLRERLSHILHSPSSPPDARTWVALSTKLTALTSSSWPKGVSKCFSIRGRPYGAHAVFWPFLTPSPLCTHAQWAGRGIRETGRPDQKN